MDWAEAHGYHRIHCRRCGYKGYTDGGCNCDWDDEEEEEEETPWVQTSTYHIARQGHGSIKAGDLYARITGFDYEAGGPRLGYDKPFKKLIARAPGHPKHNETMWAKHMEKRERQLAARRRRDQARRREQVKGLGTNG